MVQGKKLLLVFYNVQFKMVWRLIPYMLNQQDTIDNISVFGYLMNKHDCTKQDWTHISR